MMRGLALSVLWLLVGAGLAGGLFWVFLNTPESTVFTLALSAFLVLAVHVAVSTALGGALAGWDTGWQRIPFGASVASAVAILPPIVLAVLAWWLVGRGLGWLAAQSGEISAWFIAALDWSDVRPLLNAVRIVGEWIRRVMVPFAAVVWLARLLLRGWQPLLDGAALRHALAPARLAVVTLLAIVTLWAPVTYGLYWMPRGLPPTWVEPAVAIAKFAAMAVLAAIGVSLICRLAVPART